MRLKLTQSQNLHKRFFFLVAGRKACMLTSVSVINLRLNFIVGLSIFQHISGDPRLHFNLVACVLREGIEQ